MADVIVLQSRLFDPHQAEVIERSAAERAAASAPSIPTRST
jgi:hypothetical protein